MVKKKLIYLLLIVSVATFTFGCSNKSNEKEESDVSVDTNIEDSNFIKDLEKSVIQRGILVNKKSEEAKELGDEFDEKMDIEYYKSFVKVESDLLYKYEDSEFDNPQLQKLAMDYIGGLKSQEKALEYIYGDPEKFSTFWSEGYDGRSVALIKIVEDHGAELDEDTLLELKQNAQSVSESKEIENEINEMLESIDFKLEDNGGDWKEYATVIENTTNIGFDHFTLNIKLLDEDEIVLYTTSDSMTDWNIGEKVKFKFGTDEDFSQIKWSWEYYE